MMENLNVTAECLKDLIAFHTERINGYENMRARLNPDEQCLEALFDGFIRQSISMKKELIDLEMLLGMTVDTMQHPGKFELAWSVVKTVFSSKIPTYPLAKCKSGENALLIAYHGVESTDGLKSDIRILVNRQKREIIAARDWIAHFEGLHQLPIATITQQTAAVS